MKHSFVSVAGALIALLLAAMDARGHIYEWEFINPANPGLGKQPSRKFAPAGANRDAVPGLNVAHLSLAKAYMTGADLTGANFEYTLLNDAELSQAQLSHVNFRGATLTGATLSGANIEGARFELAVDFTSAQLYSTASYQAHNLKGVSFAIFSVNGWDLTGQNLTNAVFSGSFMSGTNLTGAIIRGVDFGHAQARGLTAAQIYSTHSYLIRDLQGLAFDNVDTLNSWNFADQNLSDTTFGGADLNQADFRRANLTRVDLRNSSLYQARFEGANIRHTDFSGAGLSAQQLYSTSNYQSRDLTGNRFANTGLINFNLAGQNLTGTAFFNSYLSGTDFAGAIIRGANFFDTTDKGFTASQLYSTASYQAKQLGEIVLSGNDLSGWNFAGQNLASAAFNMTSVVNADFNHANLTNSGFSSSTVTNASFVGADLRGSSIADLSSAITTNLIPADGKMASLLLNTGEILHIRDYDGNPEQLIDPIAITVDDAFAMASGSTLNFQFEADEWNSTIAFEEGISVTRAGSISLDFAEGVNISDQIGRTLELFNWTGVTPSGVFNVSSPYTWDLTNLYTTGEVTLLSVLALPGDVDGDGDVDGRDFLTWQRDPNVGSLAAWQANYGDAVGSPSAFVAVPEPAGVVLAALMLMGGVARWPRVCARQWDTAG